MKDQIKPTISIITVVKDDLEGFRATADSVLRQNFTGFEWLIVDGFSSDGTYEFAQKISTDGRISLIQAPALGIYNAMNIGLTAARGKWVWHLNAGDVLLEETILEEITKIIEINPESIIIASSVVYLSYLDYIFSISSPEIRSTSDSIQARFHHQGAILNRSIALAVGGYNEKLSFAGDGSLMDEMIQRGKSILLPIVTVGFKMGGASSVNFRKTLDEIYTYREHSSELQSKSRLVFKNAMREVVLRNEKSSILRILVIPYLIRRQSRIRKSNSGIKIPGLRHLKTNHCEVQPLQLSITVEVLSASDSNPKYLDCVRPFIESWITYPTQNGIKYVPKVLIIAEEIPLFLEDLSEYLQPISPRDLPSAYVAQASRLTEGRYSSADFVLTSDIDMFPLSLNFENELLAGARGDLNDFAILRDVLEQGQYPICYNLAKPKTWGVMLSKTFPQQDSYEVLTNFLNSKGGLGQYSGLHGGLGWTLDQELLWAIVEDNKNSLEISKFSDMDTHHHRLDRSRHRGILKWIFSPLVFFGYFHDYHVHHPIRDNLKYAEFIRNIRNLGLRMK